MILDRKGFNAAIGKLPFGKQLPEAVYIIRTDELKKYPDLYATIHRAEIAARPSEPWNLLKFHTEEFAITFLAYPDFDTDPHPALAASTKINLTTGTVTRTDYHQRANPPILHRKETCLPPGDHRAAGYAALTRREEEAGLYRDPSRIGLRIQWQALLKQLGLTYEGHTLISEREILTASAPENRTMLDVARHRTAIKRYDLSKPVKQLLERGLLRKNDTFFDYGCGHGMDVEALQNLGYQAAGWDPVFRPDVSKANAAVVNLGYVLNVIEDPVERAAALREAYSLSDHVLLVSTMVSGQETEAHSRLYRDGFLTKTNTFQKFFAPGELENLIEHTLNKEATTLTLGVCLVFRNPEEAELFEAKRSRRRIDWTEIATHLKFSVPVARERQNVDRYELHKELFDQLWGVLLQLGRFPEPGEFDRLAEVKKAGGSAKRAVSLILSRHGEELWKLARKARTEDVLVYLAMSGFRKHFGRREIPLRIKNDIRSFFGDLRAAQAKARELLFAAGDAGEIELACQGVDVGWQDEEALIIHRTLIGQLPPLLRIYIQCAAQRYGDPEQADLIKIHKHSGKVTFQHYDDFEGKPLPELRTRIKVNLRNLFVSVFDHSKGPKRQLLYFKERFVAKNHPNISTMAKFSAKLRRLGFAEETIGFGPDKHDLLQVLNAAGLNEKLNSKRSEASADARTT
jgi:DNA phosphorothioation-associated putative methyltransferase